MMTVFVRKAKESDLLKVQRLLAKAGVREEGIEDHLEHFLVVVDDRDEMIGTIGMEKYGAYALFRSFVIAANAWTVERSLHFLSIALQYAKEQKIEAIYLCAQGSNRLFQQLGFREINSDDVPPNIKESAHFKNRRKDASVWTYEFTSL